MTDTTATVVLVHGAWHDARCFDRVVAELERRGIDAIAVDRPGHGASVAPLGDVAGDATAVRAVLDSIDGPVVLVGHSYGGVVISEAGDAPNVQHLVYLTALVCDVGESAGTALAAGDGDGGEPSVLVQSGAIAFHDDSTVTINLDFARDAFYADCDDATVADAIAQLQPQHAATLTDAVTTAAWRTKPSTYVVCTQDRAIVPSAQRALAARCGHVVELDASHSPFLSMPDQVADVIEPLARGVATTG